VAIVSAVEASLPNLPPNRAISAVVVGGWTASIAAPATSTLSQGVHWRCLEAVGEENRPWLCCSGQSMSCERSIQHESVAICSYCCSQNGPQNKLLKLRMGNIKINAQF
jgi:hypothetical protein